MSSSIIEPSRVSSRRRRVWIVAILSAAAVGSWLAYRAWSTDWPSRMVLVLDQDATPLAFSPDGKTLLTSGREGLIPWDVATGTKGKPWASTEGRRMTSGVYSPDGRRFAAVGDPAISDVPGIVLFDVASGQSKVITGDEQQTFALLSFPRFSLDGRLIRANFSTMDRWRVITWNVETEREIAKRPLTTSEKWQYLRDIEPDGRYEASVGWTSRNVEIRDNDADRWIGTIPAKPGEALPYCLVLSRDRKTLAMGRADGTVEVWDVATGRVAEVPMAVRSGYNLEKLGFSTDGRLLIVARGQPQNAPTGSFLDRIRERLAEVFPSLDPPAQSEVAVVEVATGKTLAVARESSQFLISPDGRTVATFGFDGTVKLRELPKLAR